MQTEINQFMAWQAALGVFGELFTAFEAIGEAGKTSEVFYRTMSKSDYAELVNTRLLPASFKGETMVSPSLKYASRYDGITVRFTLKTGTRDSLLKIGLRSENLFAEPYSSLPTVAKPWMNTHAFFKLENGVVNIGLGKGTALDLFNANMLDFSLVP